MPAVTPTLFAFLFLSPWTALGASVAAVSVPIIIHLFSRRRYRIVTWAAMQFLLAAQKQTVRRMRLEQYLLLAVRCLILLLLVLAMASVTPWAEALWLRLFPDSGILTFVNRRTHKILVLDGSFSMGLKVGDRSCFAEACARALQVLDSAPGGDGFSVILMTAPAQRIVPEPSADAAKVAEQIGKLRLPHGNADLAGTLHAVLDMLKNSPSKFEAREVYFLTDLQRSTWLGRASRETPEVLQRIGDQARVILVDVGQEVAGNLALTQLTLGSPLVSAGSVTPVSATIHNHGTQESRPVRVELLVGRARANGTDPPFELRVAAQEMVSVPPGRGGSAVAFAHKFSVPGDYAVSVRLENDALALDDARSLIVSVRDTVPVMLVNGKPAAEEFERATGYLQDALQPADPKLGPTASPVRTRVVSESQFADAGLGDLAGFDCVFFCDVARFSTPEAKRLETHLRRGGGVVFCLGPRVDLEAYNRVLFRQGDGILPARLIGMQKTAPDRPFLFFADEESFRLPPLDAFAGVVGRFNLLEPRFFQYVRTELPAKGPGRKLLSFMPEPRKAAAAPAAGPAPTVGPVGAAAIIDAPYQRGRVCLITTTVNKDWGNWPDRPCLLALMHELLHHVIAGRRQGQAGLAGDPLEAFLQTGSAGLEAQVNTPDGRSVRLPSQAYEDSAVLRFAETDQSGIYRATVGQHPQEYLFAVNVPTATDAQQATESDLARVDKQQLLSAFPNVELQVVTDLRQVVRTGTGPQEMQMVGPGVGPAIARMILAGALVLLLIEVVLAWKLGHYSKAGVGVQTPPAEGMALPGIVAALAGVTLVIVAGVLLHAWWTGDFLGFLPDAARGLVELSVGVPEPVAGESTRWRLESTSYLPGGLPLEPWLVGMLAVAAGTLVLGIYLREGRTAGGAYRLLLAGLRVFVVLLMLFVLLPQLQLWFERQGWPDVVILIDDSKSMSASDAYQDAKVRAAADRLAQRAGLNRPGRLQLAQALLANKDNGWLEELVRGRKVKVHVFHCASEAAPLVHVTQPDQLEAAVGQVNALAGKGALSKLGSAVRTAINNYRGASLAAIIMLTDGVNTEGEDLVQAGQYASQMGVPLFFIGIGDNHEQRDLILHDLQADDSVFVNDRLVFEARLTAQGYLDLPPVNVVLSEKTPDDRLKEVAREKVPVDPQGKPVKVRLTHRPAEPGEKVFVVEVQRQADEVQYDNNVSERTVLVREAKPIHVLYIEGYPRYEYRYLKSLLERESADAKGNKSIQLKVLLLDADDDFPMQDRSARAEFPTKEELSRFDLVIVGDVDPKDQKLGAKNLKLLVDFVREQGGGLLVIGGERHGPQALKDTPLADVLPIQPVASEPADPGEVVRRESFRLQLTPVGRLHPVFRFSPDESENTATWNRLAELFWFAEGYRLQPAAEVLAVHPQRKAAQPRAAGASGDDRHPLIVQHFVGAGRCLFLGIDETWRWRFREDELHFNQFWLQIVKYLARSALGRTELRLNRSTPYRRGEPIQVTVRFPDDAAVPGAQTSVKVVVERRPLPGGGDTETEVETLQLAKLEGSRATYEVLKTRTPAGEYRFWLSSPTVTGPKPRAECKVLPPPGEMEKLRMNQVDMERAADQSHGQFYTLADAGRLLDELPTTSRIALSTPGPPWLLWNHFTTFFLVVGLFSAEWVLRKRKHLL